MRIGSRVILTNPRLQRIGLACLLAALALFLAAPSRAADADQDGLDDELERQLAEKFRPVLHKHSQDLQQDLADADEVFDVSRLKIIDIGGSYVWDEIVGGNYLHVTDCWNFCTMAGDSLYSRMWIDMPDSWWHVGADPGERPLYFHVYEHDGYTYLQYWYFMTSNDLRNFTENSTWHEGDWEHVTLRLYEVGNDYVPDRVNFYQHDGGHTRYASEAWWSSTAGPSYIGIQQGYDDAHTHLHVWIAANSHASYNRYDAVYHMEADILGIPLDFFVDNVDYSPFGWDLYFGYDFMRNMGELDVRPYDHDGCLREFDYHVFHRNVDGPEMEWLMFIGRHGDHWMEPFTGTETPAPYTPATSENGHQWLGFSLDGDYGGFGNESTFTKLVAWVMDPPWDDGTTEAPVHQVFQEIEAENGQLYSPMQVVQDGYDTWVETPEGTTDWSKAAAQYRVEITEEGDYVIATEVRADSGQTNSFLVEVLNSWGYPVDFGYLSRAHFLFELADPPVLYGMFDWTFVGHYNYYVDPWQIATPVVYHLEPDTYTIKFLTREPGAQLNRLRVEPYCPDDDNDGWTVCDGDCNDADPEVHPYHQEICGNRIDDDCDGSVDEGCSGGSPVFRKPNVHVQDPGDDLTLP